LRAYSPFYASAVSAITNATFYNCTIRGRYDGIAHEYDRSGNTLIITNAGHTEYACIINMYDCILNGYGNLATAWVTGRAYTTSMYVTVSGVIYKCASNHTSTNTGDAANGTTNVSVA